MGPRAFSAFAAIALVQAVPAPAPAAPWQIERSDVLIVKAADGHDYRVMVAWPEGEAPPEGWPTLWVLDGEDNFAIATVMARKGMRAGPRAQLEPGIITAIDSGPLARRVLDYTPPAPGYAIPVGAPAHGLATGGADAFLGFLRDRVRPLVTARWKLDAKRQTLMGHSFGGLLALRALAKGEPWTRYVAVSPSLWFGDGASMAAMGTASFPSGTRLLLTRGDREGRQSSPENDVEPLAATLKAHGVEARAAILPGQTHGTTMIATMTDGIAMAFGKDAP